MGAVLALALTACGGGTPWPVAAAPAPRQTKPLATGIPAATNELEACRSAIAGLKPAPAVVAGHDILTDISSENLPALPLPGFENIAPTAFSHYSTARDYVAGTPLDNPVAYLALMEHDGFVEAEGAGFVRASDRYGAEALRFRTPAQAADFNRIALSTSCDRGAISQMRAIPGVPDGVSFIRTDGVTPYRAVVVMRNIVVHINICSCVHVNDTQALAAEWASVIDGRYALAVAPTTLPPRAGTCCRRTAWETPGRPISTRPRTTSGRRRTRWPKPGSRARTSGSGPGRIRIAKS